MFLLLLYSPQRQHWQVPCGRFAFRRIASTGFDMKILKKHGWKLLIFHFFKKNNNNNNNNFLDVDLFVFTSFQGASFHFLESSFRLFFGWEKKNKIMSEYGQLLSFFLSFFLPFFSLSWELTRSDNALCDFLCLSSRYCLQWPTYEVRLCKRWKDNPLKASSFHVILSKLKKGKVEAKKKMGLQSWHTPFQQTPSRCKVGLHCRRGL